MLKFIVLFLLYSAQSFGSDLSTKGYSKIFIENYSAPSENLDKKNTRLVNSANRFSLIFDSGDLSLEASYQALIVHKHDPNQNINYEAIGTKNYRVDDLKEIVAHKNEEFFLLQNLDRFSATYTKESTTISLGRQTLSFGMAQFINPTDIFAPFSLITIDQEERAGVDLMRLRHYVGDWELDFGALIGKDNRSENNASYFRTIRTSSAIDTSFIATQFKERKMYGFGFQSEIFSAGVNGGFSHTKGIDKSFNRFSLGFSKMFTDDYTLLGEYNYNSIGAKNKGEYLSVRLDPEIHASNIFLIAREYINLSLSKVISPLVSSNLSSTINLIDSSILGRLFIEWNIKEDQYWDLGLTQGGGQSLSEFSSYTDFLYTSYRLYF